MTVELFASLYYLFKLYPYRKTALRSIYSRALNTFFCRFKTIFNLIILTDHIPYIVIIVQSPLIHGIRKT